MTLKTNARVAGFTFLFYIAAGISSMVVAGRASGTGPAAAKLASIAAHATLVRVNVVLTLLQVVSALVLGVTLWALTRDEDGDLAMLALTFRVAEGVVGAVSILRTLAVLSVASAVTTAADAALGAQLLKMGGWTGLIGATCFAIGSTIFCWLFLRGRSIPVALAWLGFAASLLLVVLVPAQLAGFISGAVTNYMWLPMLVFEVVFAFWLMIKGVAQ